MGFLSSNKSKKDTKGTINYANGDVYEGELKDGKKVRYVLHITLFCILYIKVCKHELIIANTLTMM